jgi:hypothetical protein
MSPWWSAGSGLVYPPATQEQHRLESYRPQCEVCYSFRTDVSFKTLFHSCNIGLH